MSATSIALEKGLPSNLDAERFVLGSIMLNDSLYIQAAGELQPDDFSLEKHRRIFSRMGELNERGERIDRVTVANELMRFNELESCDGLTYLVSLDDGLPQILNIDAYIRIVKDKAVLRRIIFASQHLMNRCLIGEEEPDEILAGAEETLLRLGEDRVKSGLVSPRQVIDEYQGGTGKQGHTRCFRRVEARNPATGPRIRIGIGRREFPEEPLPPILQLSRCLIRKGLPLTGRDCI